MQQPMISGGATASSHLDPSTTRHTPLNRSLRGILPPDVDDSHFYAVVNTYVNKRWRDFEPKMGLKLGVGELKRMSQWAEQFHHKFSAFLDSRTSEENGVTVRPATTKNIRGVLAQLEHRQTAALFYISGHTDSENQELVYLTSNSLRDGRISSDMTLSYSEMGRQLLSHSSSESLIWVTEVCECDNFMQLPYEYWCDDGEVKCKETGYVWFGGEAPVLHFAATAPGQRALTFEGSSGAVYTKALHNVVLDKRFSLGDIVKKLQQNMNTILGKTDYQQQHRIYSSHKYDKEDFFESLGFSLKTSTCQVA